MLLGTPTFSAHLPHLPHRSPCVRTLHEDATNYFPDAAAESRYADRVDESAGIVRGVKILGVESRNTPRVIGETYETVGEYLDEPYCYDLAALRESIPLFEGLKVLLNHPSFQYTRGGERYAPPQEREAEDTFGRIINVRVTPDGMFADHQYLKSHPFSVRYVEIARRMPNVLAFSPSANGICRVVGDKPTIVKITDVRSVDLVGERPGTTSSLFESESRMARCDTDMNAERRTHETDDEGSPLTAGGVDGAAMSEADDTDAVAAVGGDKDHFDSAFEKEVLDIWNGEGTSQEKAKKITQLAKKQDEIAGIRSAAGQEEADDGDDDDDDDMTLEETAGPSADADNAAKGADGIAPTKLAESEGEAANDKAAEEAKRLQESKAKRVHESAAVKVIAAKHARVVKKYKALKAEMDRREAAIYESIDLLNASQKPVRSATVRVVSREPDKKARERFIAESVASRIVSQPRSEQRSSGGVTGKPLHETTSQAGAGKSAIDELVAKKDAKAIAEFLRS